MANTDASRVAPGAIARRGRRGRPRRLRHPVQDRAGRRLRRRRHVQATASPATGLRTLGLVTLEIPLPLPAVPIGCAWHPRHDADSGARRTGRPRPTPFAAPSRPAFVPFSAGFSVTRRTFGHGLCMRGRRLGRRPRSPSVTYV
ncbi:hypothetical protein D9753_13645 [Streptomyces dangxiongensis]|uniref:Uncharacterized protein n=1 Tax=Streptomyces dangxiongensis TaxID=1442032 RepID=A0A3G2JHA0_9ACTN|nr:hypothetical protein D9753_13645 [Streptomyces dangxiongensis]